MAAPDPDLFARVISGVALLISGATLVWTRVDKHRERKAAKQSQLPSIRMRWNSQVDQEGRHSLKIGFRDIKRAITFKQAKLIKPRGEIIDAMKLESPQHQTIPLNWNLDVSANPVAGADAVSAMLRLKADSPGDRVVIEFSGHFRDGSLEPVKLEVAAPRE